MKYFIDTNIIIDLLDNKEEVKKKLQLIIEDGDNEFFISPPEG